MRRDETPEQIIEQAKHHEKIADGAESIRTRMRLGYQIQEEKTTVTRRLIFRDTTVVDTALLNSGEDSALYRALGIVRDDEAATARALRARVAVVEP